MMQLKDASRVAGGGLSALIYGDTRGRFKDGERIVTARVSHSGSGIYKTLHSEYEVEFAESKPAVWVPDDKGAYSLEASAV